MSLPTGQIMIKNRAFKSIRKLSSCMVRRNIESHDDQILDSSINTMEQILSILHNAHGTKADTRESLIDLYDSDPESFQNRNFSSLGDSVFKLRTIDTLIGLQLSSGVDIFKDSHPNHTKTVLNRYTSAFKSQYLRDTSLPSMKNIGSSFIENPQKVNARLRNKITHTASIAMRDISPVLGKPALHLDFCRINLYNPFRNGTTDPFALRKGLSTKKNPENLFGVMINDQKVLKAFLNDLKKSISPITIQNLMSSQSFFGDLALKVTVKRVLSGKDPRTTLDTPFEFYHMDTQDEGNTMREMKAIIASRSMILRRLDWFPPYRKSLAMLDEKSIDSDEKILTIMADMFDRFFGVCYKVDAKYCESWVQNLIAFAAENNKNMTLYSRMARESIAEFKSMASKSSFKYFGARWLETEYLNADTRPDFRATAKVEATRKLLNDARKFIPAPKR